MKIEGQKRTTKYSDAYKRVRDATGETYCRMIQEEETLSVEQIQEAMLDEMTDNAAMSRIIWRLEE